MKNLKIMTAILLILPLLIFKAQARSCDIGGTSLRSVGVRVGNYSPSFDYFDRTYWDFSGGAAFGAEADLCLLQNIGLRGGLGLFNTSSEVSRGSLQQETFQYLIIPIQVGIVSYFNLGAVTLSLSPGVDFNLITAKYSSGSGEQESSGRTVTFNVGGGVEKAFRNIAVELYGGYIIGGFEQDLRFSEDNQVTTEEIDLNGFNFGLKLKYLI